MQTEAALERFTKPGVDISFDLLIDYTKLAGRRWTSSVGGIPMANVLDEVSAANQTLPQSSVREAGFRYRPRAALRSAWMRGSIPPNSHIQKL